MKVLVQGAGITGIALAAALLDRGVEVELVEKAPQLRPWGYWLYLYENGRQVLYKLGLEEELRKCSVIVDRYRVRGLDNQLYHTMDFTQLAPEFGTISCIERPDLHNILFKKVASRLKVHFGMTIDSISQDAQKVQVRLSDGTNDFFDAVVGADGIHSSVRKLVDSASETEAYGMYAWLLELRKSDITIPHEIQHFIGKGQYAVLYPKGGESCGLYLATRIKGNTKILEKISLSEVADKFYDFGDPIKRMLPLLKPAMLRHSGPIAKVRVDHWFNGRIALAGDAAHAFSPLLGQGASLSLEDAVILAEEIAGSEDVIGALKRYESRRIKRVGYMQDLSDKLMLSMKVRSSFAVSARDTFISKVAPDDYIVRLLRKELQRTL